MHLLSKKKKEIITSPEQIKDLSISNLIKVNGEYALRKPKRNYKVEGQTLTLEYTRYVQGRIS